jgi:sugar lactone lactonase YvrE
MRARAIKIKQVHPAAGIEGGRILIEGSGFDAERYADFVVTFGGVQGRVLMVSNSRMSVQIPDDAKPGPIAVSLNGRTPRLVDFALGVKLIGNVHPVDSPAFDRDGNLYVTFSGRRGETVPVSIFKITPDGKVAPHLSNIANATSVAFDPEGNLYVSSRFEGNVYKATPQADVTLFAKELGVPTGLAFNKEGMLFVGDRGGRIWKVTPKGEATIFAEVPESMIAFHLAFDPEDNLLIASPGLSSSNYIYLADRFGKIIPLYGGLGRPQGLAADTSGNIYVCDAKAGDGAIYRISPQGEMTKVLTGPVMVGLAFDGKGNLAVASPDAVYKVTLA